MCSHVAIMLGAEPGAVSQFSLPLLIAPEFIARVLWVSCDKRVIRTGCVTQAARHRQHPKIDWLSYRSVSSSPLGPHAWYRSRRQ
jgi:hypothetical protein